MSHSDAFAQTMEILAGSLALNARNPGFPELAHLPTVALRRFVKMSNAEKFRSQATLLLHAINANAKFVGIRRDSVDFAPKDANFAESFLRCDQVITVCMLTMLADAMHTVRYCQCRDDPDTKVPLLVYAQRLAEKGAQKRLLAQSGMVEPSGDRQASDSELVLV